MPKTPGKIHMYDMVKIDSIVFEIVGGGLLKPPPGSYRVNCQSLQAKFSQIKMLVDTFAENNTPIQVLCLQDTWFENSDLIDLGIYQIEDYHFVTQNRYASAHGGLAFYIHHN